MEKVNISPLVGIRMFEEMGVGLRFEKWASIDIWMGKVRVRGGEKAGEEPSRLRAAWAEAWRFVGAEYL